MGTAEEAGLGEERKTKVRPRDPDRPASPMHPSPGNELTSPSARDAVATRESAAGARSRSPTPRAGTPPVSK